MSYQKDPVDKFVEGLFYAGASAAWAVTAVAGSLVIKLIRKSPEKRLKNMKQNSVWGEDAQAKVCPRCETPNEIDMPLCSACGTRL
jgi:hypothetical protein